MERTLYRVTADGTYVAVSAEELVETARAVMNQRLRRGTQLSSPRVVRDYLAVRLGMLEQEVFCVLLLDNRFRVIDCVELFRGSIDGASVHPREVVKLSLARNAAAVLFAHQHPSGIAEPSRADEALTKRLVDALALVDIRVLDHVIVAGGEVVSLADRGLI
jgi:DNA repair protein RadC